MLPQVANPQFNLSFCETGEIINSIEFGYSLMAFMGENRFKELFPAGDKVRDAMIIVYTNSLGEVVDIKTRHGYVWPFRSIEEKLDYKNFLIKNHYTFTYLMPMQNTWEYDLIMRDLVNSPFGDNPVTVCFPGALANKKFRYNNVLDSHSLLIDINSYTNIYGLTGKLQRASTVDSYNQNVLHNALLTILGEELYSKWFNEYNMTISFVFELTENGRISNIRNINLNNEITISRKYSFKKDFTKRLMNYFKNHNTTLRRDSIDRSKSIISITYTNTLYEKLN